MIKCWCGYLFEAKCKCDVYVPADGTATLSFLPYYATKWVNSLMPDYPGCHGKQQIASGSMKLLQNGKHEKT